jgi:biopolymer transport protein ExbD
MPLIDLVMLLVLFFALAQGVIQQPLIELALPKAAEAKENERPGPEPVISVTDGGVVNLNGEPVTMDVLASTLSSEGVRVVRLRGDGHVNYGVMKRVLSVLRAEGVPDVRLMVSPYEGNEDAP